MILKQTFFKDQKIRHSHCHLQGYYDLGRRVRLPPFCAFTQSLRLAIRVHWEMHFVLKLPIPVYRGIQVSTCIGIAHTRVCEQRQGLSLNKIGQCLPWSNTKTNVQKKKRKRANTVSCYSPFVVCQHACARYVEIWQQHFSMPVHPGYITCTMLSVIYGEQILCA